MPIPGSEAQKRTRDKYSRLICLQCRERRIRCELPDGVELPNPGELRIVSTPCFRCKKLSIPCVIRQTILGRPGSKSLELLPEGSSCQQRRHHDADCSNASHIQDARNVRPSARETTADLGYPSTESRLRPQPQDKLGDLDLSRNGTQYNHKLVSLSLHKPKSQESVMIIRAIDTLHREHVQEEWFRHLPAYVGRLQTLDLSVHALVAACAHQDVQRRQSSNECWQALANALHSLKVYMHQSRDEIHNDMILASTALLAPFESTVRRHGLPSRQHVGGMAAILASRPAEYPVSDIARDILDFHLGESCIMACVQGTNHPLECIAREYYANNKRSREGASQAQLQALGNELFIRLPRLVQMIRAIRESTAPIDVQLRQLLQAFRLSASLLQLRDDQAEHGLMQLATLTSHTTPTLPHPVFLSQHFSFSSIRTFEALAFYWQTRLTLLRLNRVLHQLSQSHVLCSDSLDAPRSPTDLPASNNEIARLAKAMLRCLSYAGAAPLRKTRHVFAQGLLSIWGAVGDVPDLLRDDDGPKASRSSVDADALAEMLLPWIGDALAMQSPLTVDDLNVAAEIFIGGELGGRIAEFYGS